MTKVTREPTDLENRIKLRDFTPIIPVPYERLNFNPWFSEVMAAFMTREVCSNHYTTVFSLRQWVLQGKP